MDSGTIQRYKTDFNEVGDDGTLTTLAGWGGSVLIPRDGQLVELFDGDANTCLGFVVRVETNALIYVIPDWDSWHDAPDVTVPTLDDALFEAMRGAHEGQKTTTKEGVPA